MRTSSKCSRLRKHARPSAAHCTERALFRNIYRDPRAERNNFLVSARGFSARIAVCFRALPRKNYDFFSFLSVTRDVDRILGARRQRVLCSLEIPIPVARPVMRNASKIGTNSPAGRNVVGFTVGSSNSHASKTRLSIGPTDILLHDSSAVWRSSVVE